MLEPLLARRPEPAWAGARTDSRRAPRLPEAQLSPNSSSAQSGQKNASSGGSPSSTSSIRHARQPTASGAGPAALRTAERERGQQSLAASFCRAPLVHAFTLTRAGPVRNWPFRRSTGGFAGHARAGRDPGRPGARAEDEQREEHGRDGGLARAAAQLPSEREQAHDREQRGEQRTASARAGNSHPPADPPEASPEPDLVGDELREPGPVQVRHPRGRCEAEPAARGELEGEHCVLAGPELGREAAYV